MSMMAFKATGDETAEIDAYMKARHFKSRPDFFRVAVFAYIRQNKPGKHGSQNHTARGLEMQPYEGGRVPPHTVAMEGMPE